MQVIYKLDKFFLWIHSAIILFVGIIISITFKNIYLLIVTLAVMLIYLYFTSRRIRKRLLAVNQEFSAKWQEFLHLHSPFYTNLSEPAQKQFERDIQIFLSDYSIIGTRQQIIPEEIKLLIAASVATMLHGRPDWEPPIPDGILVYPGERFNKDYELGKGSYAGMAAANQPLILTEGSLKDSLDNPYDGYNVVIHEVAHYFDLEDGRAEGLPASRLSFKKLARWKELIQKEWQKVIMGKSFLRDYAGVNEAEFFAVACESFFENPRKIYENNPDLYLALKDFFNLDTLNILAQSESN